MMKKPNKPFDMQNFLNKPFDMQNFLKKVFSSGGSSELNMSWYWKFILLVLIFPLGVYFVVRDSAREIKKKEENLRRKREEHLFSIKRMCNKDELIALEKNEICIGMHILVVEYIKGQKYDEKRNVSANKTTLKYKYGRSLNQRDNWSYELEVTFINDRVTAFKDL